MLQKKIKGSILQYAVVASILIFFLLLSLILLTHIQSYFRLQSTSFVGQIEIVNSAIERSLQKGFDLIKNPIDSVTIEQGYLGAFKKVMASTKIKGTTYTKTALIGANLSEQILYLEDTNKSLALVGDTYLKGRAYIPAFGIKAGVIAGTYFSGKNLITEPASLSSNSLPRLDDDFRNYVSSVLRNSYLNGKVFSDLKETMTNSFKNEAIYIYDPSRLVIGEKLLGNIVVKSGTDIRITQGATITEASFIAPIVKIDDGFRGTVHIIASDSIVIGRNVILEYPSSLVISEKRDNEIQSYSAINISEESEVNGNIVYLKNSFHKKQDANIFIEDRTTINGAVYCEGNLELVGTVRGTVYTHQFLARSKGSNYVNHILDGTIVPAESNVQWGGLPLQQEKKGVVKWLY